MKNIHLLPTEKPSRLFNCFGKLEIGDYVTTRENLQVTNQHIYITSDEEITGFENNIWVIKGYRIFLWQNTMALVSNNKPKKIILTTDADLIYYGVQEIDDEFLEWFVKNPSCESVEVNKQYSDFTVDPFVGYKILIPKEEPKQETLEEAAENWVRKPIIGTKRESFIEGAKWQQERIENKSEQLINELESLVKDNNLNESYRAGITASIWRIKEWCELKEWFKQFKKK